MSESDPDYFSKEAVLARLRAGKMGSDRNKRAAWAMDGVALLVFFSPWVLAWVCAFVAARFVRGAPTPLGWINLALIPVSIVMAVIWQASLSPF